MKSSSNEGVTRNVSHVATLICGAFTASLHDKNYKMTCCYCKETLFYEASSQPYSYLQLLHLLCEVHPYFVSKVNDCS